MTEILSAILGGLIGALLSFAGTAVLQARQSDAERRATRAQLLALVRDLERRMMVTAQEPKYQLPLNAWAILDRIVAIAFSSDGARALADTGSTERSVFEVLVDATAVRASLEFREPKYTRYFRGGNGEAFRAEWEAELQKAAARVVGLMSEFRVLVRDNAELSPTFDPRSRAQPDTIVAP